MGAPFLEKSVNDMNFQFFPARYSAEKCTKDFSYDSTRLMFCLTCKYLYSTTMHICWKNLRPLFSPFFSRSGTPIFLSWMGASILKNRRNYAKSEAYGTASYIRYTELLRAVLTVHLALQILRPVIIALRVSNVVSGFDEAVLTLRIQYASMILEIGL